MSVIHAFHQLNQISTGPGHASFHVCFHKCRCPPVGTHMHIHIKISNMQPFVIYPEQSFPWNLYHMLPTHPQRP